MWPRELRHEYERAFKQASYELKRTPRLGEYEHLLSPCARQELVEMGMAAPPSELEELEATLVPCGC